MKRALPSGEVSDLEIRYRRLFEAAQDGILLADAQTGAIRDVNPCMVKLVEYSRAELLEMSLWDFCLFEDVEACKEAFRALKRSGLIRYENLPLRKQTGDCIEVEVVGTVYLVRDECVVECTVRERTARKDAELSAERILQGQKLEAIGQLAGGLAHDFNNLLGVILGYCEVLDQEPGLSGSALRMVGEIANAGTTAKNLTQQLLAFSRRQVLQPVYLDLNATIRNMDSLLYRLIGESVDLSSTLSTEKQVIKADPSQLEQILMNLVINACDAMPQGGKIVIATSKVELGATSLKECSAKPGAYVLMTVSDTGIGMDLETQRRIFEPFFSTKAAGQGTGLGLSTVSGIVRQSGGMISVDSEPGNGTVFKVFFPRCNAATIVPQKANVDLAVGGSETILLVDDSTALRVMIRRLLQFSGYTVIDTGDPAEALRLAAEYEGAISLMITDVIMPEISGSVLAERLALVRPETRVLLMSAYPDDAEMWERTAGREYAFLQKPFKRDSLLRAIRASLDV